MRSRHLRQKNKEKKPAPEEGLGEPRCPLVAIGASAGGLEVFGQFFDLMPSDSGMAFVVLQHLDPTHETLMPELLAKHTEMKVLRVEDGQPVQGNQVYVIGPNISLEMEGCRLRVKPLRAGADRKLIDHFFRSAGEEQRESVVGVILSGTGSDGALGLRAVKEHGGLTLAQSPETARFDSMPRNAILSGFVDLVLPVQEMPERIIEYVKHLNAMHHRKGSEVIQREVTELLPKIFSILRKKTGHDFSRYKQSTLTRRIQRRMQVLYLDAVVNYVEYLSDRADEVEALFKDLLIGVTQFFRDEESFEIVAKKVIPALFEGKKAESQVRVWVPGCASGEEAYSFAILLTEYAEGLAEVPKIQIFATDLDTEALQVARKAIYPEEVVEQVSARRLGRFFKKVRKGYEVVDKIRELCVFSPHNLIKDPPFSRLDLVSCRNLLIYFEIDLQKKLLPLFHYALNPSGYLFLGPSENVASRSELFRTVDAKHRIFQRKPTLLHSPISLPSLDPGQVTKPPALGLPANLPKEQSLTRSIERLLLDEYSPASVVINAEGDVIYFSGETGKFLKPPAGAPSNKLLAMAKKHLRLDLRAAVHRAQITGKEVVRPNLRIKSGRQNLQIDLVVRPLTELGNETELYIVLFRELTVEDSGRIPVPEDFASPEHPVIKQLENELRSTREELQNTIEELETSNEELKSANEELLSMNEELQSANEELQTSKEEIQSANDELQIKIEETDRANAELRRAHEDRARLAALVQNSDDAIIGKTLSGTITSWNKAAERIFGYSAEEMIGEPIFKIIPETRHREETRILQRLREGERVEHYETDRLTKEGRVIEVSLTASPIRDSEGHIVGASKIARDITAQKEARRASQLLVAIVDSSEDAIVSKTLEGIVTSWNKAAEKIFGYTAEEMIGKPITTIFPEDRLEEEIKVLSSIRRGERIEHFETIRKTKDGRLRDISLTISPIKDADERIIGASKIARDITEEKAAARASLLLAAVVDSSEDAIVSKTLEGIITSWNKAAEKLFGYTSEEMIGKPITKLFPADRLDEEPEIIRRIAQGERVEHFETLRKAKDGRLVDVSLTISPIKDRSGRIIGASKIARDISTRKAAEKALREAKDELEKRVTERTASLQETTEALETFCYTVAHDLRSPLRAQQSFAQVLIDDYKGVMDESGLEYARRILQSAERLDRLVHDLLTYSRLSRAEIRFESIQLQKVLDDIESSHAEEIRAANAIISRGELHAVAAYEPTLNLIATNLITNALKFVPPGIIPRVKVWSERKDGRVRLWVEDNGIGIAPENTTKIFGVFQRLHPVNKYPGTGIGLAIVQKGVERMGGKAGVESELGKGSRFWIELPAARGSNAA